MNDLPSRDYIAGFIDGEGCFNIAKNHQNKDGYWNYIFHFSIILRDDDIEIIKKIQTTLGNIGIITPRKKHEGTNPQIQFSIQSEKDIRKLIEFLGANPFHGKKSRDYDIWTTAFLIYFKNSNGQSRNQFTKNAITTLNRKLVGELQELLITERKYK